MGDDVSGYFSSPSDDAILTHTMTSDKEGVLRRLTNNNPDSDFIKELSFNVVPGDYIKPFTNGRDRTGQIIIKADTLEECRQ